MINSLQSKLGRCGLATTASLFVLLLLTNTIAVGHESPSVRAIAGGWSYHWGDLSYTKGNWDYSARDWKQMVGTETPPGRANENILWLKLDLPQGGWRDPYLFIGSIDLTAQVFSNNKLIYEFGSIDLQGNSLFAGWPWHLIRLPDDYAQHPLFIRVFSDYPYIGPAGDMMIGNKADLLDRVYRQGFFGLFFVVAILLVSIMSAVLGVIKKDKAIALTTAALSLDLALMMFAENELSQVVLFAPLLWRYIAAFSYFLVPAFLSLITYAWFKRNVPVVSHYVLLSSILFSVGVTLLSLVTEFNFVNAYPFFDLFFVVAVLALFIGCFRRFRQVGLEGMLISFGILALFISLGIDMLSAHGFIDWIGHAGQWGLVLFSVASLTIYLVRDRRQQLALSTLTHTLERQVEERTAELVASQNRLKLLAREDHLTKVFNRRGFTAPATVEIKNALRHKRPLSIVLFDIDFFKEVNDRYGHSAGDCVLKAIADVTRQACRDGDLICRFGGEEFVILLHATDSEAALKLVERLRLLINEISIKDKQGNTIRVTSSFGIAQMSEVTDGFSNPDQILSSLLTTADETMYAAKKNGRDTIRVYSDSKGLDAQQKVLDDTLDI